MEAALLVPRSSVRMPGITAVFLAFFALLWVGAVTAFVDVATFQRTPVAAFGPRGAAAMAPQNGEEVESDSEDKDNSDGAGAVSRRQMFSGVLLRSAAAACGCLGCAAAPRAAWSLAQITGPPPEALELYDLPRNSLQDAGFAYGMAVGMERYEREARPAKERLFRKLFAALEGKPEPVVVEVGMGSFPNAHFYKQAKGLDIIGVDPNDSMTGYATGSAALAGLFPDDSLRIVHGVSEALPLADASCDAVVCTLTLCSVVDPAKSVAEIRRVLKPGGKFLFWEHVLSETDPGLAQQQILMTPNQVKFADGCHLDRRTGDVIRAAGFQDLDMEYFELKNARLINPTVCGIATA